MVYTDSKQFVTKERNCNVSDNMLTANATLNGAFGKHGEKTSNNPESKHSWFTSLLEPELTDVTGYSNLPLFNQGTTELFNY